MNRLLLQILLLSILVSSNRIDNYKSYENVKNGLMMKINSQKLFQILVSKQLDKDPNLQKFKKLQTNDLCNDYEKLKKNTKFMDQFGKYKSKIDSYCFNYRFPQTFSSRFKQLYGDDNIKMMNEAFNSTQNKFLNDKETRSEQSAAMKNLIHNNPLNPDAINNILDSNTRRFSPGPKMDSPNMSSFKMNMNSNPINSVSDNYINPAFNNFTNMPKMGGGMNMAGMSNGMNLGNGMNMGGMSLGGMGNGMNMGGMTMGGMGNGLNNGMNMRNMNMNSNPSNNIKQQIKQQALIKDKLAQIQKNFDIFDFTTNAKFELPNARKVINKMLFSKKDKKSIQKEQIRKQVAKLIDDRQRYKSSFRDEEGEDEGKKERGGGKKVFGLQIMDFNLHRHKSQIRVMICIGLIVFLINKEKGYSCFKGFDLYAFIMAMMLMIKQQIDGNFPQMGLDDIFGNQTSAFFTITTINRESLSSTS